LTLGFLLLGLLTLFYLADEIEEAAKRDSPDSTPTLEQGKSNNR